MGTMTASDVPCAWCSSNLAQSTRSGTMTKPPPTPSRPPRRPPSAPIVVRTPLLGGLLVGAGRHGWRRRSHRVVPEVDAGQRGQLRGLRLFLLLVLAAALVSGLRHRVPILSRLSRRSVVAPSGQL